MGQVTLLAGLFGTFIVPAVNSICFYFCPDRSGDAHQNPEAGNDDHSDHRADNSAVEEDNTNHHVMPPGMYSISVL